METFYIAGWRDGIRNPDNHCHWRLYRGLATELIPARDIVFLRQGREMPMKTGSSKHENSEGFHVWFDCVGTFQLDGATGIVDLSDAGQPFSFSVRTKTLYTPDDWLNWRVYSPTFGVNVSELRLTFEGRPVGLATFARKISDPRELLAWIEARGGLVMHGSEARIEVID